MKMTSQRTQEDAFRAIRLGAGLKLTSFNETIILFPF